MQIHNLVDWRTHLATLRRMKEAGSIRYIGITHYTDRALSELAHILETEAGIDFVQCGYSLAARAVERWTCESRKLMPFLWKHNASRAPWTTRISRIVHGRGSGSVGVNLSRRDAGGAFAHCDHRTHLGTLT